MDQLPPSNVSQVFEKHFHQTLEDVLQNTDLEEFIHQHSLRYDFDYHFAEKTIDTCFIAFGFSNLYKNERIGRTKLVLLPYLSQLAYATKVSINIDTTEETKLTDQSPQLSELTSMCDDLKGVHVINHDDNGRRIIVFFGDFMDVNLSEIILQGSFYLKAYAMKDDLPFIYGVCSNLNSFRFVKYDHNNGKLSLSEQIDISPIGELSKELYKEELHRVSRRIAGLFLGPSEKLY